MDTISGNDSATTGKRFSLHIRRETWKGHVFSQPIYSTVCCTSGTFINSKSPLTEK